jgi:hypothetical protein
MTDLNDSTSQTLTQSLRIHNDEGDGDPRIDSFSGIENHLGWRESGLRGEFYGLKNHLGMWEPGLRGERGMGTQEYQGIQAFRIEWLSCLIDSL